eukprot:CAMPEP_0115875030 /NCGR_PEP_ID=MMETSP0287-20121206/24871_1 /TAXON_ID=412157 /ORGANISM="Chrysochromulina rotalis, Strain UIO044" /LENGTH=44 /DNA_ID= /DNA_START= /DNA_END= /DNA_ORIENTATION=
MARASASSNLLGLCLGLMFGLLPLHQALALPARRLSLALLAALP